MKFFNAAGTPKLYNYSTKLLNKIPFGENEDSTSSSIERRSSDKSDQLTNSSFQIENNKQKCIHLTNNNNSATTPAGLCNE
uniref:Uncharacterized protein n=1 Tax=Glossina brevipalpis TaxID=37001 RepID=A0A1A9WTU0_9MUSC